MAATPDQLIKNLLSTIDESILNYNSALPAIQRQIFAKVIELSRQLELTRGRINPSVVNVRLISQIKKELDKIILTKSQQRKLDEFTKTFDTVDEINSRYFSTINEKFTPAKVFAAIKKQTIDITIDQLTNVNENVALQVRKILSDNIKSGGMFNDFVDQMRTYLTDTKTGDGALVSRSKQITTDALNQYNANYNQLATADLGLVWYKYVGSLIATSREWCIKMIEAKQTCMPYVHESQFPALVRGEICGKTVAINKKTGLPYGMKEETTADTLFSLRGGWSCGHQFYPVSSAIVPKNLREKFE